MFDNPNFPQSFREYKNLIRAEKKWNKCFGIGSNKTATSTLDYIFQNLYGFSSNQSLLEINATIQVMRGNFNPLFNTITFGILFNTGNSCLQRDTSLKYCGVAIGIH